MFNRFHMQKNRLLFIVFVNNNRFFCMYEKWKNSIFYKVHPVFNILSLYKMITKLEPELNTGGSASG